jgi:hypothetical protein
MIILLVVGLTCIGVSIYMMRLEKKHRAESYSDVRRPASAGDDMGSQVPPIS